MGSRKRYIIGKGLKKRSGVIICHPSVRRLRDRKLYIGKNATCLSNSIIYEGSKIGDNLFIGHNSIIREENIIGDNLKLWNNSIIDYGCKIGNNVKIHCNVYIAQYTELEDDVFLAPGVVIANDIHPGCKFSKECMRGPVIKSNAKIGANVVINPFVVIGKNSFIGSGSVVTKDIPDDCLAYGNPARVKKKIYDLKCVTGITDFPYKYYVE